MSSTTNRKLVGYAKAKTLDAMYQSVSRMNEHITNNNPEGVLAEQRLQVSLRANFEEFSHEPKAPSEG